MNVFPQPLRAGRALTHIGRSVLLGLIAGVSISCGSASEEIAQTAESVQQDVASAPAAEPALNVLRAPHSESGTIGRLELGQTAEGELKGSGDDPNSSYHTYTVTVPPDTSRLIVKMSAKDDLDLGIKHGSAIETYGDDADWDMGDDSQSNSAKLVVEDPEAGTWYIDVIDSLYSTDEVAYTLEVQSE